MPKTSILLHQLCPMRDMTALSTDIYLPESSGKFPCILVRTPYSNNTQKKIEMGKYFAERGYAVAIQDVRGRYDSDGIWNPFRHEAEDGIDAQAWLAAQPFCNGNIGLMGRSYEGYCVWAALADHHPAVKTAIPIVPLPDPVRNVPYQDGALCLPILSWVMYVHGRTVQDISQTAWDEVFGQLPLHTLDSAAGFQSKIWQEWMDHPTADEYWRKVCYFNRRHEVDLPLLHVCGWYDDDGISTYENYTYMRKHAKTPFARDHQKLLIGPWPHATNTKCTIEGVDFGEEEIIDFDGVCVRWFDRWLKGIENKVEAEPRAKLFLMGLNRWIEWNDWEHPDTCHTPYYLHSEGKANSLNGDGSLSLQAPREEPADKFIYDPSNPTPYVYDLGTLQIGGPTDQRDIESRDDVLVYTTEPLENDLWVCGKVSATIFVKTSVEDTDFTAKLVDVFPDGTARQLCDGIIRLSARDGLDQCVPANVGEIYELNINMWATGNVFLAGHRIRLEIASSAFPKFARHLNTLESPSSAVKFLVAEQTIYHDERLPSHLLLPIVKK